MAQGDKTLFAQMVQVFCELIGELEVATEGVATLRYLSIAEGEQLDVIGEIVTEPRLGRSDADYKTAIEARIQINASCGEPERLIAAVAQLTQSTEIHLIPAFPAGVYITFVENSSITLPATLFQTLLRVCAAGVKLYLLEIAETDPFTFDTGPGWDVGHLGTLYV